MGKWIPWGLDVQARADRLAALERNPAEDIHLMRTIEQRPWIYSSPLFQLRHSAELPRRCGYDIRRVPQLLSGGAILPWTRQVEHHVRSSTQKWLYGQLHKPPVDWAVARFIEKLRRWKLVGPPKEIASRVRSYLLALGSKVQPHVLAAVFSALWNRWTTHRRFQK